MQHAKTQQNHNHNQQDDLTYHFVYLPTTSLKYSLISTALAELMKEIE